LEEVALLELEAAELLLRKDELLAALELLVLTFEVLDTTAELELGAATKRTANLSPGELLKLVGWYFW